MTVRCATAENVGEWLQARRCLVILSHEHPDGDSLGSLFGFWRCLQQMGRKAHIYVSTPLPPRYQRLLPEPPSFEPDMLKAADGIVCLDVTEWDRVDRPAAWHQCPPLPLCVIDHHPDNRCFGEINWIEANAAATAAMLSRLLRMNSWPLPAAAAEFLLMGVLMDTGGLRFANTTAAALREVEFLMDNGADYQKVVHELFLCESYPRLLLKAHVLQNAKFAYDRQLVYALLDKATMTQLGVSAEDTEGVIDALKTIDGVKIACLLRQDGDWIRVSLRSKDTAFAVNKIAHDIGGGGHVLAAGAKLRQQNLAEAELKLLELTQAYFRS